MWKAKSRSSSSEPAGVRRGNSNCPNLVLIDRDGRVVEEYYGYPGRQGFDTKAAGRAMTELGI